MMEQAGAGATRGRSLTQLALTIFAIVLSIGAYALVQMGLTGKAPKNVTIFVAVIALSYLVAHFVTVKLAPGADPVFLPIGVLLAGLGYAMVYRLDPALAQQQFVWLLLGLALYCATLIVIRDQRSLNAYTYTIGLVGFACLLLPIVPGLGETINGGRLWVHLGPINFQPSEIAKLLIVVFLAGYLNQHKELLAMATRRIGPIRFPEPRYLGPILLAWLLSMAVLFVENDLGSSLLFFGIFVVMLWLATSRGVYLALGLVLFVAGAALGYALIPHVQDRVVIWLHALSPHYVTDQGYQVAQGEFAMATGGLTGTGLGQGHPGLIPFAATDFIFAAFGEELGMFGVVAILLLYVTLAARGFKAALNRRDDFSKLLAAGLTTVIALQTFVIVGGVTRLIPLTGITLPFVSYGGSSLVTNFVLLALLVRISAADRPRERGRPRRTGGRHRDTSKVAVDPSPTIVPGGGGDLRDRGRE